MLSHRMAIQVIQSQIGPKIPSQYCGSSIAPADCMEASSICEAAARTVRGLRIFLERERYFGHCYSLVRESRNQETLRTFVCLEDCLHKAPNSRQLLLYSGWSGVFLAPARTQPCPCSPEFTYNTPFADSQHII